MKQIRSEYPLLTVHSNLWYHPMQHTSWTHVPWLMTEFTCCSHTPCLSALERVQMMLNNKSILKTVFFPHIDALWASALRKPHSEEASLLMSYGANERQVTAILAFTFLPSTFNCFTQYQIRNYNSSIYWLNTRKPFLLKKVLTKEHA